jgi:hypothetical protein
MFVLLQLLYNVVMWLVGVYTSNCPIPVCRAPYQTFTKEALQTGFGPTGNTIPEIIACIYSHNHITTYFKVTVIKQHLKNCEQPDLSYNALMLLIY